MLKVLEAADSWPVTVDRVKQRLKIRTSGDDQDLDELIKAATKSVEMSVGLYLQPTYIEETFDCWERCQQLHAAPVREIAQLSYLDIDDNEVIVADTNYYWYRNHEGALIHFVRDYSFPGLSLKANPIIVKFRVGFDDDGSGSGDDPELELPPTAVLLVLFLVAHWHENREVVAAVDMIKVPKSFEFLVSQLKVFR